MRGIHADSHVPGSRPTRGTAKAVDARWRTILILALPLGAFVLVQSFLPLGSAVKIGADEHFALVHPGNLHRGLLFDPEEIRRKHPYRFVFLNACEKQLLY